MIWHAIEEMSHYRIKLNGNWLERTDKSDLEVNCHAIKQQLIIPINNTAIKQQLILANNF